jgi:hypothetical protein
MLRISEFNYKFFKGSFDHGPWNLVVDVRRPASDHFVARHVLTPLKRSRHDRNTFLVGIIR